MLKRATLVAAAGLALVASGCAEEREPISWIQPDALDKSFFVGKDLKDPSDDPEFYAQGTLVDVGFGASQNGLFTSTYAQPLARIKWVIQEKQLIGRLTYERIDGTDGKGNRTTDDGIIVAVYPITSHFDIRKQYNPSTGEEYNIIVENSSDRHWHERQYMRVDWSKNLNVDSYDYDTLSQMGIYGGVSYEPLAYYVNDPTHPDAPRFDMENGYFDVTNKAFARPKMADLSHLGWGIKEFPACWLPPELAGGTAPSANCNPVELTIRQSFKRVENTDYEPADWDGYRFQAFGAFNEERYGYEREYGMTDDKWRRFITRYNLWERSHYYDDLENMVGEVACYTPETTNAGEDPRRDVKMANGDDGANGTHDECEAVGRGSRCDIFTQKCTLPFRDREVKPFAWFYTSGNNPEYFDSSEWATQEWDASWRIAVNTARYTECMRDLSTHVGVVGAERAAACRAEYPVPTGQQDDNQDLVALVREVQDCRLGRAYAGEVCEDVAARLGAQRGYTDAVIKLAQMPAVVELCHSPVEANDPEVCGGPRLPAHISAVDCHDAARGSDLWYTCANAKHARLGDLRYHQVNVLMDPQTPSPWGIMVDADDPLTGEKVSASVNVWSHVTDLWSRGIIDTARYIKGELTTEEITDGKYIEEYASLAKAGGTYGATGQMTAANRDELFAAATNTSVEQLRAMKDANVLEDPGFLRSIEMLKDRAGSIRASALSTSAFRQTYESRRQRALGSNLEAELTTPAMQQFAGADKLPNAQVAFEFASPLRGADPVAMRNLRHLRELTLAERGACMMYESAAPVATAALVDLLEEKFGKFNRNDSKAVQLARADKMRRFLAQRANHNVMLHEMGHSVGLRHNFVSSSDAFGFRPQYWQLRTDNGETTQVCQDLDPTGDCVGPRYFDPVNQNERDNLIQMFMQSSVMDYAGEATQDMLGLGIYDFAAVRMFYGDVVSVFESPEYRAGQPKAVGMSHKLDNFGGIIGITPSIGDRRTKAQTDFHYSEYQNRFGMIKDCENVPDPYIFRPANWNEDRDGEWHPLLDGLIVKVGGEYSRCRQTEVDYVNWDELRHPVANQDLARLPFDPVPSYDRQDRTRVAYGFATDGWADTGNLSVFRHDNGADPYELFDYFIGQQEMNHIFDMYRRGRTTFSVRGAATRNLARYNEKMRDAAKGLSLYANIYREILGSLGFEFDAYWAAAAPSWFPENVVASKLAFDHFTRMFARPQAGPHIYATYAPSSLPGQKPRPHADGILRALDDHFGNTTGVETEIVLPNGATGRFGNISFGGKQLENRLAEDKGEFRSSYTISAGSYYEKLYVPMLMAESADNFISSSRQDFLDSRHRAVSLADLFPDAYRRWLGNNLTGDDFIKGVRLEVGADGKPLRNDEGFPSGSIGWTSWLADGGPASCFAGSLNHDCRTDPTGTVVVDPQVGWEQQKFLIAFTLQYLPENQKQTWLNHLWLWELGSDNDPGFQNRIEFHDPHGRIYVAKAFGKEQIFGKTVERGVAGRVLEYANELLAEAYVTDPVDHDGDGIIDWYVPQLNDMGMPIVKYDRNIRMTAPTCNETDNSGCVCTSNAACMKLDAFVSVPYFLREAIGTYGLGHPSMKGLY